MLYEVSVLEKKLGLAQDFLHRLYSEDDWSFVIKLNALFEAAATHLLTHRLVAPELLENFTYLDYGNSKFGKVVLLKRLNCINKDQAKFMQFLFELRNKLAHTIADVSFDFNQHLSSLDPNQRKSFVNAIKCGKEKIDWNCAEHSREKYILTHPKLLIYLTAMDILVSLQKQQDDSTE